jgi:hypothetical protein
MYYTHPKVIPWGWTNKWTDKRRDGQTGRRTNGQTFTQYSGISSHSLRGVWIMLASCCMPWRREWCTMEAVGQRRPPWFIGGGLCALPSFHLGKACSESPTTSPTNNQPPIHPIISMNNWWMRAFKVAILRACLLGSHLCHGIFFPHHLGASRARQSSGRHGWVVCVVRYVY